MPLPAVEYVITPGRTFAARTRAIIDDNSLAESITQLCSYTPRHHIGRAARRKLHDDAHGTFGKFGGQSRRQKCARKRHYPTIDNQS